LTLDLAQHRFGVTGDPREIALPDSVALKLYTAQSELLDQTPPAMSGSFRTAVPLAAPSPSAVRSWLIG
jgi:hypothetical protein